jgi:DNA repair photolyase
VVTYTHKEFKSILIKRKFIDSWFWDRYGINGYNGCEHSCIYCDSRSAKYYLPEDFENDIIVKKNVREMLDKRITSARTLLSDIVAMSGASDPYHSAEAKFRNTLQCIEILEKHKFPVHIITKSKLVLRDLEILERIGKNNWCSVSVTITTENLETAKFFEPRVSTPSERFNIIKTIKNNTKHIQAGVFLIPVIPFLCDSDEALENMVRSCKESQCDYMLFGGAMTMRDNQALWYLKHLELKFPELIRKYEELYKFKYNPEQYNGTYGTDNNYNLLINRKLLDLCNKYELPFRIKRFIPEDFRRLNYLISEKLLNHAFFLQVTGQVWSDIHWAGMNIQNLKESVADIAGRNELRKIRNVNSRIEAYIMKFLHNQAQKT